MSHLPDDVLIVKMLLFQPFVNITSPQFAYQIVQEQIQPPNSNCTNLKNQLTPLIAESLRKSKLNFLQRHNTEQKFNVVDEEINNLNRQITNLNSQELNNLDLRTKQNSLQQQIIKLQAEREKLIEEITLISKEEFTNLLSFEMFNSRLAFECLDSSV
jgi:hypothetical protein